MHKIINNVVKNYGLTIGKVAVSIATISPACCRGEWYQPKEPERLHEILKQKNQKKFSS